MKRIAVWNTAFLGDAVLTLPLIQTLADAFPGSEIDFYVRRGLASLFEAHPALHAVYEYDKRRIAGNNRLSALLKSGRILGGRRYDIWIGAHPSPRSALLARLSGAPLRVGYIGGPVAALCYNRRVSRRFSELHEIERLLELLKPILPPETPRQHWPELTLPSEALEKAAAFRESLRQGDQEPVLLGLHPGSVWGTKRWLPSGFAEIARRAAARCPCACLRRPRRGRCGPRCDRPFGTQGQSAPARLVLRPDAARAGRLSAHVELLRFQ